MCGPLSSFTKEVRDLPEKVWLPKWMWEGVEDFARKFKFHQIDWLRNILRLPRAGWYSTVTTFAGRETLSPSTSLRIIQGRILTQLQSLPVSSAAHAYLQGRSIISNAEPHRNSRSILCLDLADAFGQACLNAELEEFGFENVRLLWLIRYFCELDLPEMDYVKPSVIRISSNTRKLPQGALTSPAIFNHFMLQVDDKLLRLAAHVGGVYTRYADNIFFSMPEPHMSQKLVRAIKRQLHYVFPDPNQGDRIYRSPWKKWVPLSFDLVLNQSKTRLVQDANRHDRPLPLCGLNIVAGELHIRQTTLRRQRAAIWAGLKSNNFSLVASCLGYVKMIYGDDLPRQISQMFEKAGYDPENPSSWYVNLGERPPMNLGTLQYMLHLE